jgi:catechol 2,3-dioxygenase-like lactoylglutathione lyase family enzyme
MTFLPRFAPVALIATMSLLAPSTRASDASAPARPRFLGLSHVALFMHDVAQSRAFYKDFLGYDEPYSLKDPDGGLHLTWIKINDQQTIELFTEKEAGSDRLHQVAFIVEDADAMRRYLAAKGVKVPDKTTVGRSGNANFTFKDPDGHTIEMVQYLPDGWTRKDDGQHLPATRIAPRIRHAGFMVGDLEVSMKFYRDILGFEETWRGSSTGKQLSWVNMKIPGSDEYVEFMLYDAPPATERMRSMNHICLEVADVAKAEQILKGRTLPAGCRPLTPLKNGINGKRQINAFDPDGTRVEIMEPTTFDGKPVPSSAAPAPHRTTP